MASLKERSVKGFLWAFAEKWAMQFVNFGVAMVLARLLTPTTHGITTLATSAKGLAVPASEATYSPCA